MSLIQPIQVARLTTFCGNSDDTAIAVSTGLNPSQKMAWQIFQVDFFVNPEEIWSFDWNVSFYCGLQIIATDDPDISDWQGVDEPGLIAQFSFGQFAQATTYPIDPLQPSFIAPLAHQWRPPVSMYVNRPYLALGLVNQMTNIGFQGRANVYYKIRELDPLQQALMRL